MTSSVRTRPIQLAFAHNTAAIPAFVSLDPQKLSVVEPIHLFRVVDGIGAGEYYCGKLRELKPRDPKEQAFEVAIHPGGYGPCRDFFARHKIEHWLCPDCTAETQVAIYALSQV